MRLFALLSVAVALSLSDARQLPSLICEGSCAASQHVETPTKLAPPAYQPIPLGNIAPSGWLLDQLIRQANSLSGYMAKSTFPGANTVNMSRWVGGNGSYEHGTTQWLPYWTNGNVPLVELIRSAGALERPNLL